MTMYVDEIIAYAMISFHQHIWSCKAQFYKNLLEFLTLMSSTVRYQFNGRGLRKSVRLSVSLLVMEHYSFVNWTTSYGPEIVH